MWYPFVSKSIQKYRIGYGHSEDGRHFIREDQLEESNLKPSQKKDDFDNEAVCYPYVFENENELFMLYNGNNFGETGFGIAKWIK